MTTTVVAGRYTLETEVGRGGMGAVWRGRDDVLGRTVALKRIGVAPGGITPDAVRAEREAKLAARLNHANVVAVFDLVSEGDVQWLVMEYVEGTDLGDLIKQRGRLSPDEAVPVLAQTARALAAAHGAGIVHRDVKPSNILVSPDGQVKLSDFGIARTSSDPALTQTGLVTGSPAYLSPEVASGQQATPASDVWSWGATLFHALEGHAPYQIGDNLLGALYRIVHEEPPRPAHAGWLTPLVEATMTRDPARRWSIATAEEFLDRGPREATVPVARPTTPVGPSAAARTRTYDDQGTSLLPLAAAPVGTPGPPPATAETRRPSARPGRRWLLVALAVLALAVVTTIAFVIGLGGDDGDGDGASTAPSGGTTAPPSSEAAQQPTAKGMEDFVRTYIDTVVSDPTSAFDLLTPAFQDKSNGLEAYEKFWGPVQSATIDSVSADPQTMRVSYTYTYRRGGDETTEDITLVLQFADGQYRIADEL
ncbi:serine/threonine protein kinase [Nocardioides anomalus]|uniref:non-specific serine/threonine protein kinase n=1 Tax=Nocardioides anomalus TaxID=2712223 RepID=A0A6G6WC21_9ACTN|nr:serine/threonine-protein kinase [Nocardioides anomalus]QIG42774.1 serine/threonine protein kinase [Nocardioides anomalus]